MRSSVGDFWKEEEEARTKRSCCLFRMPILGFGIRDAAKRIRIDYDQD
jgi:hypothetical protein